MSADCVPESLCAVMNYWGKSASVEELSFLGRTSNVAGIPFTQVPALARQKGFKAAFVGSTAASRPSSACSPAAATITPSS
ncbi:MAG: hypothetical protein HY293_02175 [Planctomycetes bacterium]|nr:hypothetical protein [Planctomycetota bacterium]